jgi:hypothetical protein
MEVIVLVLGGTEMAASSLAPLWMERACWQSKNRPVCPVCNLKFPASPIK